MIVILEVRAIEIFSWILHVTYSEESYIIYYTTVYIQILMKLP